MHLAANVEANPPIDRVVRDNVVGTYNVFEAARRAGVRRVIYASSGATVSDWERDEPYAALVAGRYDQVAEWPMLTHESPMRPHGLYGCSKIWGEALARHFADTSADVDDLPAHRARDRGGPAGGAARVLGVVQPARHRPDGRALPGRPGQPALRRLLRDARRTSGPTATSSTRGRWSGFVPEDRAEDHRGRP